MMFVETIALPHTPSTIRFSNGTSLEGIGGVGCLRQRIAAPHAAPSFVLPASRDAHAAFTRALQQLGMRDAETLEWDVIVEESPSDQVSLTVERSTATACIVVLYQDESGGLSWHFEQSAANRERAARFVIPLRTAEVRRTLGAGTPRRSLGGPFTKVGRKMLKILELPTSALLLKDPRAWFAEHIEPSSSDILWQLNADNYKDAPQVALQDWKCLREGPSLLLIHDLLGTVEGMLAELPRFAMAEWCRLYDGRVFGFNHRTVTETPEENARALMSSLTSRLSGAPLQLDVLSHGRGGIVCRALSEHQVVGSPSVRGVYFIATPHLGSPLADAGRLANLINVLSNCQSSFPDGPAGLSLRCLLGLVALAGHHEGLIPPGIAALATRDRKVARPSGRLALHHTRYAGSASSFVPKPGRDNAWFLTFAEAATYDAFASDGQAVGNDLLVAQHSALPSDGAAMFPIVDALLYVPQDDVWHGAFFRQERTLRHISQFLDRLIRAGKGLPVSEPGEKRVTRGGDDDPWHGPFKQPPESVARDPEIEFPHWLESGAMAELVVRLHPAESGRRPVRLQRGLNDFRDEIELTVAISAPAFTCCGSNRATLRILRERDPVHEQARFKLTAPACDSAPMERVIEVCFWRGMDCVAAVQQRVVIVPRGFRGTIQAQPPLGTPIRVGRDKPETVDLVFLVRRVETGSDVFELEMRCNLSVEGYESRSFGRFDLERNELSRYLTQELEPSFQRFPRPQSRRENFDKAVAEWNQRFLATLESLGKRLWMLLPERFRSEYLRLIALDEPPRSISIFSDELLFPWELVQPSGDVRGTYTKLPALGVAHTMGRWRPGTNARPRPQAFRVMNMAILAPRNPLNELPFTAQELRDLRSLIPAANEITPANLGMLQELLSSADVQLVHFSGHCLPGANSDLDVLQLESGEKLDATTLAYNKLGHAAHPVLFLNACSAGCSNTIMGRPGGFAGHCIEGGWSGVVAPYWPIYDPDAARFSVIFYKKLLAGKTVGEALQELRAEHPDDPTALSYTYFGDPFARLVFSKDTSATKP